LPAGLLEGSFVETLLIHFFNSRKYRNFSRGNIQPHDMRKYITELIGTFFLVLTVGMVVIGGKGDFAPLAIGASLMVMIFAGGHISGGHYNPAVTLAVLLRGRINIVNALCYWIVQIVGAGIASLAVMYLLDEKMPAEAQGMADTTKGLLAEFLGTFALAYVVLNTATAKGTKDNSFYGLAIGFTVMTMAYAMGGISGAAFNPAVAFGISLMKLAAWNNIWVYLVGCLAGAALAALVFRIVSPEDHQKAP
jgi:aquaporin Z